MPGYAIGNFFVYAVINAITPGPGNILALNTVGSYGWKKGKPLFFGIFAGYYMVQILCAVFVFGVSTFLPNVLRVMKYIGAAYILWLAIHIAIRFFYKGLFAAICQCKNISIRHNSLNRLYYGLQHFVFSVACCRTYHRNNRHNCNFNLDRLGNTA